MKKELKVAEQYANQQQLLILLSQQNHTKTRALLKAVDKNIRDLDMVVLTKGNASDVDKLQSNIRDLATNYSRLLNRVLEVGAVVALLNTQLAGGQLRQPDPMLKGL